jgi:tungstate transport system permease protein
LSELWDAIAKAFHLIISLDPEVIEIARRSLFLSASSCAIAALICLPLGSLIHFRHFPGKKLLISLIQTSFSMPTVTIGLIAFVLLSRAGPLGVLGLFLTPAGIVIGQAMLITPIMLMLIISSLSGIDKAVSETAISLGANRFQTSIITIREAKYAIVTAVVMGFGRAISELGISSIVGGNLAGYTRTLTTAIQLETQRGDLELALAMGFILIFIAFVVNLALYWLQHK